MPAGHDSLACAEEQVLVGSTGIGVADSWANVALAAFVVLVSLEFFSALMEVVMVARHFCQIKTESDTMGEASFLI